MNVLLALLFMTAMASVDVRPQANGIAVSAQSSLNADLEDGPEGEEAPIAVFLRSGDGDDQIGSTLSGAAIVRVIYFKMAADCGHHPASPSHSPCSGFPTGPPAA
jgi:hypothetical protein